MNPIRTLGRKILRVKDDHWGYWNGQALSTPEHKQQVSNAYHAGKQLAFTQPNGGGNIVGVWGEYDQSAHAPNKKAYPAYKPSSKLQEWQASLPPPQEESADFRQLASVQTLTGLAVPAVIMLLVIGGIIIVVKVVIPFFKNKDDRH
jgi:hypothetical protein